MTETANDEEYGDYGGEESEEAASARDSDSDRSSDYSHRTDHPHHFLMLETSQNVGHKSY